MCLENPKWQEVRELKGFYWNTMHWEQTKKMQTDILRVPNITHPQRVKFCNVDMHHLWGTEPYGPLALVDSAYLRVLQKHHISTLGMSCLWECNLLWTHRICFCIKFGLLSLHVIASTWFLFGLGSVFLSRWFLLLFSFYEVYFKFFWIQGVH